MKLHYFIFLKNYIRFQTICYSLFKISKFIPDNSFCPKTERGLPNISQESDKIIMKNQNNKPISIAALGMDKQTQKILEMVFNGPGKGDYVLIELIESAQACIFDMDSLDGMNLWKDHRTRYPQLPTILLSLTYKDIAGTFYVKKPIEFDKLLKALNKLKQLLAEQSVAQSVQEVAAKSTSQPPQAPRDVQLATDLALEQEEEATHQFCGYAQDINPDNPKEVEKVYYEPSQYLQGFFQKAFVIGQQLDHGSILIEGLHTTMILQPKQNQILRGNECNNNKLRTMTLLPLSNSHLRITTLSETEVEHYVPENQLVAHPLDKFLWRVALWTARGRVPKGTDLHKKIVLLQWPNFTRLIVTPHALKIAALWMAQPHSLLETAKLLEIPQRDVFAFFSATSAIQLAFVDRRSEQRTQSIPSTNTAKRGLFQRLLARLRN